MLVGFACGPPNHCESAHLHHDRPLHLLVGCLSPLSTYSKLNPKPVRSCFDVVSCFVRILISWISRGSGLCGSSFGPPNSPSFSPHSHHYLAVRPLLTKIAENSSGPSCCNIRNSQRVVPPRVPWRSNTF